MRSSRKASQKYTVCSSFKKKIAPKNVKVNTRGKVIDDDSEESGSDESTDVAGKNVYTFITPKRKNQMATKATSSAKKCHYLEKETKLNGNSEVNKTPKSAIKSKATTSSAKKCHLENETKLNGNSEVNKTPKSSMKSKATNHNSNGTPKQTPHTLRSKIKSRLNKMATTAEDSSSQESCSSESDDSDNLESVVNENSDALKSAQKISLGIRRSSRIRSTKTEAEKYFVSFDGKSKTSDHTLQKLGLDKLDRGLLKEALGNIPQSHSEELARLMQRYIEQFPKWQFQLSQGFNLIIHGLGSKISLLEKFQKKLMKDNAVLVVNGFFPSLTLKQILHSISHNILDHQGDIVRPEDHVKFIHQTLKNNSSTGHLYIIIHNIDSVPLRNDSAQNLLCSLVQSELVHIVASVDHINSPLLWDQHKMGKFNWIWHDCTTFLPYLMETSYENSLFIKQSGSLALSSLRHVFHSLTPNAKAIYQLLSRYQLEHGEIKNYTGMAFHDCYLQCRREFLVNSELTLKAQLIEFKDHELLKMKKGADGGEYLFIPLDSNTITEFLKQQEVQI